MPSKIVAPWIEVADIVLDSSVVVATLDASDVFARRANELCRELREQGHSFLYLDFLLAEVVAVLGRRAEGNIPVLGAGLGQIRQWARDGEISFFEQGELIFDDAMGVVLETAGRLSFNDAALVVLQREGAIGDVASFDTGFDTVPGFRRVR